jgi:hypothetical protein
VLKWFRHKIGELTIYINLFQAAESGFAILKHLMSIIAVLSQSLLLCWLGERHIQQVCATRVLLIRHIDVSAHLCATRVLLICDIDVSAHQILTTVKLIS